MKALRKSLTSKDVHHPQISTPLPAISKPPQAIVPPQKVIRSLASYRSKAPQELSFQKGDFFYVVRDVSAQGEWFEAHNPMTGARGLVPKSLFEEFHKGPAPTPKTSPIPTPVSPVSPQMRAPGSRAPKTQAFYAIVLHDFVAERTDELDAKAGDSISVVAQSNREWFVAKPIGKLGKPGLIPVTFVEVRDPITNQPVKDINQLMDSGSLPRVEEWKKQIMNYKATSIALGTLDDMPGYSASSFMASNPVPEMPEPVQEEETTPSPVDEQRSSSSSSGILPEGLLLTADVPSFHLEMEDYWFRIHALYQPYGPAGSSDLPKAMELVIFRTYQEFYEFQKSLIASFPRESGEDPESPRILPFMPGPSTAVDDQLSKMRQEELREYMQKFAALSRTTARYMVEHHLTRQFLALKPGDVENESEPQYGRMEQAGWYEPLEEPEIILPAQAESVLEETMAQMKVSRPYADSEGSDYGDDDTHIQDPPLELRQDGSHPYNGVNGNGNGKLMTEKYQSSLRSRSSGSSSSRWPEQSHSSHNTQATSPVSVAPSQPRSSITDASSRSRSQSLASSAHPTSMHHTHAHAHTPSISVTNPQTAFIKIKIFDRVTDDLIAIRVHPKVTHEQLMDKVQTRLGGKVEKLSYRESLGNRGEDFVPLAQDGDLRHWLENTEKHVLYAD